MAGNLIPLLLVGGVVAVVSKKKKKKKKKKSSVSASEETGINEIPPADEHEHEPGEGSEHEHENENDEFGEGSIPEGDLEFEQDPSGDEAGDFEEKTEVLLQGEDDVFGEIGDPKGEAESVQAEVSKQFELMKQKCDTFISAIHIVPTEEGEMPINKISVEQSIMPAMMQAAHTLHNDMGAPFDEETMGPHLVLAGLEAVAPECGWEYSDATGEFRYAGGQPAQAGKEMGPILLAMFDLSVMVIDRLRDNEGGEQPVEVSFMGNQG